MFSLNIRQLRIDKNLTIEELAAKSGVSYGMISRYELGKSDISLSKLIDLATALDTNFWELVIIDKSNSKQSLTTKQSAYLKTSLEETKKIVKALSDNLSEIIEIKINTKVSDLESSISDLLHDVEGLELKLENIEKEKSKPNSTDAKGA